MKNRPGNTIDNITMAWWKKTPKLRTFSMTRTPSRCRLFWICKLVCWSFKESYKFSITVSTFWIILGCNKNTYEICRDLKFELFSWILSFLDGPRPPQKPKLRRRRPPRNHLALRTELYSFPTEIWPLKETLTLPRSGQTRLRLFINEPPQESTVAQCFYTSPSPTSRSSRASTTKSTRFGH